jgi:hypothetical protein
MAPNTQIFGAMLMYRRIFSLLSIFLITSLVVLTPSSNARFVGEWESSGAPEEPYLPSGEINYTCMILISARAKSIVIHARQFKKFTTPDFQDFAGISMSTAETDDWEYSEDQVDTDIPKLKSYLAGQTLTLSFTPSGEGDIVRMAVIPKLVVNGVSVTTYVNIQAPRSEGQIKLVSHLYAEIDAETDAETSDYTSLSVTGECLENR